jgi:hypothetical protein
MKANKMTQANLDVVLLDFRAEAGAPKSSILDAYCRRYPQFARELTDYALEWLIDEATAQAEAPVDTVDAGPSSHLVSRAISRLYEKMRERDAAKENHVRLVQEVSNPFDALSLPRVRAIRDELGIDTPLLTKFRNRLIDPDTVPGAFLERFARLVERKAEEFFDYMRLPPMVHAAGDFKAESKPSVMKRKESFEDAVRGSSLDEKQKQELLKG